MSNTATAAATTAALKDIAEMFHSGLLSRLEAINEAERVSGGTYHNGLSVAAGEVVLTGAGWTQRTGI